MAGDDEPELLVTKAASTIIVPQELLDDYADMSDLLGKALRGEIEFKPLPPPRYHRCLVCWLVSKLPGHGRCQHGRLGCDECESDW